VVSDCVRQFDATMQVKATLEMARADLSALLRSKVALIVIDDVWPGKSAEVAKALLVPSLHSRFVLTTRFPQLAVDPEIKAEEYALDEMSFAQAEDLLTRTVGRGLTTHERQLAMRLCTLVGGHPMALELAAARIRGGRSWGALLEDLAAEIARFEALEYPGKDLLDEISSNESRRRKTSVRASLSLSIRYLNPTAQHLFAWLGVVAADSTISARLASTLWSLDVETAEEHLRALSGLGILRPNAKVTTSTILCTTWHAKC
jgi:NB-ARC domain